MLFLLGGCVIASAEAFCISRLKNILTDSGPVMSGECSEKSLRYGRYTHSTRFFHKEDDYIEEKIDEKTTLMRLPQNVATPEQARERVEKNKTAFADLLGWRMSFDDFCKKTEDRKSFAVSDIHAKFCLIEELWSKKFRIPASDIAREQFEMGIQLLADVYSEYEGKGMAERRYGGMTTLYRGMVLDRNAEFNLAGEMAYFLFFRQKRLEDFAEHSKWMKLHDGLIHFYADNPEGLLTCYEKIPFRLRVQWLRRQKISVLSSKATLEELEGFLNQGPIPGTRRVPATPCQQKAIENLKAHWNKLHPPAPMLHGGKGHGC